jgi:hypothetical protein
MNTSATVQYHLRNRNNRSTTTVILDLLQIIKLALFHDKKIAELACYDLNKAFDTIFHGILSRGYSNL